MQLGVAAGGPVVGRGGTGGGGGGGGGASSSSGPIRSECPGVWKYHWLMGVPGGKKTTSL